MQNRRFRSLSSDDRMDNIAGYAALYYVNPELHPDLWEYKRDKIKKALLDQGVDLSHQITVCGCSRGPDAVQWIPNLGSIVCLGADSELVRELEG